MAWHLYLLPVIGDGTRASPRKPKYLSPPWAPVDFGAQPIFLVAADVSDAQDAAIVANADARKVPDDLDSVVGAGNLAAVQNDLESRNIPGTWVAANTTWRTIARAVMIYCFLFQRYGAVAANYSNALISGTVTLDTTFGSLPLQVRQNLQTAAQQLGLDTSGFTGASTLRQILVGVGSQWIANPRRLGEVAI